jgi:hypothetical protein
VTSKLYTHGVISSNRPDVAGKKPERAAVKRALRSFKLNAWLALATACYLIALFVVRRHPDWSPLLKITVSLSPILPGLLYLREGLRHLRRMDELERRIQGEAWLFAALGTVLVSTIVNVLNSHGLAGKWPAHGLEVGETYLTMFILWCLGTVVANRRYQ